MLLWVRNLYRAIEGFVSASGATIGKTVAKGTMIALEIMIVTLVLSLQAQMGTFSSICLRPFPSSSASSYLVRGTSAYYCPWRTRSYTDSYNMVMQLVAQPIPRPFLRLVPFRRPPRAALFRTRRRLFLLARATGQPNITPPNLRQDFCGISELA
jgi:hypothetical protein